MVARSCGGLEGSTYGGINVTNVVFFQEVAGVVRVANIFEGTSGVLGTFIEKNFFPAGMLITRVG